MNFLRLSLVHFANRVAQNVDILGGVRGYQNRFALRFQVKQILAHIRNSVLVKTVHRLIENQQIGIPHYRLREMFFNGHHLFGVNFKVVNRFYGITLGNDRHGKTNCAAASEKIILTFLDTFHKIFAVGSWRKCRKNRFCCTFVALINI